MSIVGDVKGKTAVIVDDLVDTCGTLMAAVKLLKQQGAIGVIACATHGVLSGAAFERLAQATDFELIVTDTCDIDAQLLAKTGALKAANLSVVTIAPLLAVAIRNSAWDQSLSDLFILDKLKEQVPLQAVKTFK